MDRLGRQPDKDGQGEGAGSPPAADKTGAERLRSITESADAAKLVTEVVAAVTAHNTEHDPHIKLVQRAHKQSSEGPPEYSQEFEAGILALTTSDTLGQHGLQLSPVRDMKAIIVGPDGKHGEVRLRVADGNKFVTMLGTYRDSGLNVSPDLALAWILSRIIWAKNLPEPYRKGAPNPRISKHLPTHRKSRPE